MAIVDKSGVMEKDVRTASQDSPSDLEDAGGVEIDLVAEKKLVRKLDLYLIPVTMLLYLLSFLDRYVVVGEPFNGR